MSYPKRTNLIAVTVKFNYPSINLFGFFIFILYLNFLYLCYLNNYLYYESI